MDWTDSAISHVDGVVADLRSCLLESGDVVADFAAIEDELGLSGQLLGQDGRAGSLGAGHEDATDVRVGRGGAGLRGLVD